MSIVVRLTVPQAAWVDWALTGPIAEWDDPEQLAHDHAITIEEARLAIQARDQIELKGETLTLPEAISVENEVISDILNMLEDVAPDVAGGYGYEDELRKGHAPETADLIVSRKAACARNAAEKIREAIAKATTARPAVPSGDESR